MPRDLPRPRHGGDRSPEAREILRARFVRGRPPEVGPDKVAREEPLEIQLGGASLVVVMRTPGHDEELALGLLLTERVVSSAADVASIRHCTVVSDPEAEDNVIRVTLSPGVGVDLERLRRNLYASSSCGVCGKATIENVLATAPPLRDPCRFAPEFFH
ncbi:MAG: formate dehydrogenase accessory sulfurtransferase FdhD, partial [Candidatus Binatia bacterium]